MLSIYKLQYTLQLADTALINGHRLSEWCGHGPVLEQDIAISNIALDHLGAARSLYQYAADQFNKLDETERKSIFSSPLLQQVTGPVDEDDLAYLRDGWDFRNVLLVEQPNHDWAYTIARSFFLDTFNYFFYTELQHSKDETLAAVAAKSLKEVTYHIRWSSEWVVRLGDGTEESHNRMQEAINEYWRFTGELMTPSEADNAMHAEGIGTDLAAIKANWKERIVKVLEEAMLTMPADAWMQQGGKNGLHSEHLGYILTELQFVQRAYPNMEW
ncbi:1,2-phenylacetyl-CoA epoxidase subunit PaaC [Chitinophagaceae bacterium MMS25-I14]